MNLPKSQPPHQHSKTAGDDADPAQLSKQISDLQQLAKQAQEKEKRALADYQNLLKRTQEEKSKMIKLAGMGLVEDLLQPLEHLGLAATQLNDSGLNMVVEQLWQKLSANGLEKIEVLNQEFDVTSMEAVEVSKDGATKVIKEVRPGFKYNGYVIQHAKVILG